MSIPDYALVLIGWACMLFVFVLLSLGWGGSDDLD